MLFWYIVHFRKQQSQWEPTWYITLLMAIYAYMYIVYACIVQYKTTTVPRQTL